MESLCSPVALRDTLYLFRTQTNIAQCEIAVGDLVTVLAPKYNPIDRWTGRTYRVVALRTSKISGCRSAALAPSNLVGVDESDEVVDISIQRLQVEGALGGRLVMTTQRSRKLIPLSPGEKPDPGMEGMRLETDEECRARILAEQKARVTGVALKDGGDGYDAEAALAATEPK